MGWQDAPLVDESVGKKPSWMDAPIVDEPKLESHPSKLESILPGISSGVGRAMYGTQELLGKGIKEVVGEDDPALLAGGKPPSLLRKIVKTVSDPASDFLIKDAQERRAAEEAKIAPYKKENPITTGVSEFGGEMLATAPLTNKLPVFSGAKGLMRVPQAVGNIASGTAGGAAFGGITEGEKGIVPGAVGGAIGAGVFDVARATGAGAGNLIGPHLPKMDAASLLPQAIQEYIRKYLPKAFQGETTGAERAALETLADPRVGEVEKAGLRKLMEAHNPTLAKQVDDAAKQTERSVLEKLAGGTTQEEAMKASNIASKQVTSNFVPKMTKELDTVNAASKTIPFNLSNLNKHLDTVMDTPGIRMSDDTISVLEGLKEKFQRAAKLGGGTPNAHDIYEIRKSGINEIVDKITGRKNPDVSDKLTAKLTTELKPYIDDAIEKAGGKDWTNILQEYSKGMHTIDQQGMATTALKLHETSPQKLVDLAKGNAPDVVESQFGKGNFSFTDEMAAQKLKSGQAGPINTSVPDSIKKVAEAVGKRLEADDLGAKGAQKAMKILRADESTITAPGFISWKVTTANKIINALSGKGGEKTNDALAKFMLSDNARMDKLMSGLPQNKQQMLLDAIMQRAAIAGGSKAAQNAK